MDRGNACRMQILEKLSLVENRRLNLVSNYSLSRNSEKLWHFWQQLLKIHVGQVYLIYAPKCGLLLFSWFCFLVHFGHVCFTCVFGICHRTDRGFSFMCFHTVHTSANELKTRQTFGNIRLLLTFIGITGVVSAVWLICQSLSRSVVANKSHSRHLTGYCQSPVHPDTCFAVFSMAQSFQQEYMQIPPITRAYTTSCVLTTLAVVSYW